MKILKKTYSQLEEEIDKLNNLAEQLTARVAELSDPVNMAKRLKGYCDQFPAGSDCKGCKFMRSHGCALGCPESWEV
jgi:hypothetical protein